MTARRGPLADKGVVVTGAGRGIGRALAVRAAQEGARVVVNDLDAANARAVADEVGGTAVPGDVTAPEALLDAATEALGRVDVFFANAGIDGAGGADSLQAPDDVWDRVLDVNVMAHVRAARVLVPRWLADGAGGVDHKRNIPITTGTPTARTTLAMTPAVISNGTLGPDGRRGTRGGRVTL